MQRFSIAWQKDGVSQRAKWITGGICFMAVQSHQERFSRTPGTIDENFSMHLLRKKEPLKKHFLGSNNDPTLPKNSCNVTKPANQSSLHYD